MPGPGGRGGPGGHRGGGPMGGHGGHHRGGPMGGPFGGPRGHHHMPPPPPYHRGHYHRGCLGCCMPVIGSITLLASVVGMLAFLVL